MTTRFLPVLLGVGLLSAGCGSKGTFPSPQGPVRVTVQATPTFVGGSDATTMTVRVDNISRAVVDLTFPSSCQVLPYFVDRATGLVAKPRGGGFACATLITRQTLGAGEGFSQVFMVKAGDAPVAQAIVLPAGDYSVYARLEDSTYQVLSDPFAFSVR